MSTQQYTVMNGASMNKIEELEDRLDKVEKMLRGVVVQDPLIRGIPYPKDSVPQGPGIPRTPYPKDPIK